MSTITLPQFPGCSAVTKPVKGTPVTEFKFSEQVEQSERAAFARRVFDQLTRHALEAAKLLQ